MRRWLIHCCTYWLILLAPSLIGWGLVIRWNNRGTDRFHAIWSWVADKLAFPLLIESFTDRCWSWLESGSSFQATIGFSVLLFTWCLMLALPLSILLAWLDWLSRRLAGSDSGFGDTGASVLNVLYVITIPVAVIWHVTRWLARSLRPAIITFMVVWLPMFIIYVIVLHRSNYFTFPGHLLDLSDAWYGYLGSLGMHRVFASTWDTNYHASMTLARNARDTPFLWYDLLDHPTHYPYVYKLLALFAAMHALLAAIVVGVISAIFRIGGSAAST